MSKRFFLFLTTTVFIAILSSGCSNSNRGISLYYNLEKGESFRQKTVTQQTVTQEFQGEAQTVVNTVGVVTTYFVLEKNQESSRLKVSYDTLDIKIKLPNRTMEFSSRGEFWKQDDLFSQVLNSMAGKSFEIVMNNSTGKITAIEGLEKLFADVLGQFQTANQEQFASVMEMLNKSYGESAFKDGFEATNGYVTGKEMKKGEQWEVKSDLSNLNSELELKWEVKEIKKDEAIIVGKGDLTTKDENREIEVEGVLTKMELTGNQISNFTIDAKTGWPISGKVKQDFKGVVNLREPNTGETATLPLEMLNVITYTSIK